MSLRCVYIFIYFLLFKVWWRRVVSCALLSSSNHPSAHRIPRLYCIGHSIFLMTSLDLSAPEFVARCIQETREIALSEDIYCGHVSMSGPLLTKKACVSQICNVPPLLHDTKNNNVLITNEMHNSYNQFLLHSFLRAPHVSNESSRSSSGA